MRKLIIYLLFIAPLIAMAQNEDAELPFDVGGSLIGTNLYLSYISLDLINESLVAKNPINEKMVASAESIIKINQELNSKIERYKYIPNLSYEDNRLIYQIDNLNKLIKDDAALLLDYLKSKNEGDYIKFIDKHRETWDAVQKLLTDK